MKKKKKESGGRSNMIFPCGIAGAIAYEDNVLSDDLCQQIIDYAESHQNMMYEGPTVGGLNRAWKNCYDFAIGYYSDLASSEQERIELGELNQKIYESFSPALNSYCGNYDGLLEWVNRYDTGYQFQKYLCGEGFYKVHCDGGVYCQPPNDRRVVAVIMYLNTVEKGGGTNFPLHDVTINAVRGRVAFFPTNFTHPHAGLMPLSSEKYIISTFCYDLRVSEDPIKQLSDNFISQNQNA